jgi:hypothetical protein
MKKTVCVFAFVLILVLSSTVAHATSNPVIQGPVAGLELCPQFVCGAAIFVGGFQGQIGPNPRSAGLVAAAFTHEDLPGPGQSSSITGGVWELRTIGRRIRGIVLGGTLFNNGNNTFTVSATLVLTSGGAGTLTFAGILNHNTLVPTFGGTFSQ